MFYLLDTVRHLHFVLLFVHSIKVWPHSDQFCSAIVREFYSFAFGILLDLGYANRIETENRGSFHCIF